jgi:hypothetical protein
MNACRELAEQMRRDRLTLTSVTDRLQDRLGEVADSDGKTVRDLMAHYASWQRLAVRRIGTLKAGGEINLTDDEVFNPLMLEITRLWSDDEVRWDFDDAFESMVEAISDAPEEACQPDGWAHRYANRMAGSHYPDHLPDLERLASSPASS